jgi:hypothetical protein
MKPTILRNRRPGRGLVVFAVLGVLVVSCGDDDSGSPETTQHASTTTGEVPATTATAAATVSVSVGSIEGAVGSQLAGVLFRGATATNPDRNGVGGFAARVDADPFSTTQQVLQPQRGQDWRPFPGVSEEPLRVEPGTYTLDLWLAPQLGPYSRWVPAGTPGLAGCETTFDVGQGALTVEIDGHGIVPMSGELSSCITQ